jgi:hypothetical protein
MIVNSDVRLKVGIIHEIVIKRLCSFKQKLYFFCFFLQEEQGQGQGQQGGKRFLIRDVSAAVYRKILASNKFEEDK